MVDNSGYCYAWYIHNCNELTKFYSTDIARSFLLQVFAAAGKMAVLMYVRACAFIVMKERRGAVGMMWAGVAMSCGTVVGSVLVYILTVVFQLFNRISPCLGM